MGDVVYYLVVISAAHVVAAADRLTGWAPARLSVEALCARCGQPSPEEFARRRGEALKMKRPAPLGEADEKEPRWAAGIPHFPQEKTNEQGVGDDDDTGTGP